MVRHSLLWGVAIVLPALVMVIVDATTREVPNQNYIAIGTSVGILFLFVFSNVMLGKALAEPAQKEQG